MKIQALTPAIGAEISGVNLGDASRDADLFAEIKAALLKHRVIFLRDQAISKAEHVAFARRFGDLEGCACGVPYAGGALPRTKDRTQPQTDEIHPPKSGQTVPDHLGR